MLVHCQDTCPELKATGMATEPANKKTNTASSKLSRKVRREHGRSPGPQNPYSTRPLRGRYKGVSRSLPAIHYIPAMKSPPPLFSSPSPKRNPFSACLITLSFILFIAFLYGEDFACVIRRPFLDSEIQNHSASNEKDEPAAAAAEREAVAPFSVGRGNRDCDLFEGEWIHDEEGRPQYEEEECPYIQPQLTCQAHGRPESAYQHLRWQPRRCYLPSFNASLMLEKLRGKRMMYVGDSLNRGQFVSMICLLHRIIPDSAKSMETFDSLMVFRAKDYNATIEFYWAPFLVESNSDNAIIHRISDRIVRARSINKHARHWKGADIIVFNTYLWWMTGQKMKILRGSFDSDTKNIVEMETDDAYRLALRRMVKWVEKNMNPNQTRVFFTSMSPSHEMSDGWGGEPGGNCYNETTPIKDLNYWGRSSSKGIMRATREVFERSKAQITLINITQLSEYRKDAHTSIYKQQWSPLTKEKLANPRSYADCVHWCLPGLQDTWNELLYAKLFFP